ncbi:type II toxin-antitoxin system HigB family toxin [Parabacteroides sp. AF17-28]|uniref:type II toxin-antitoxin system HigB family toxin n=2 Tax=Parabacteroides TaxID=375288 RepID=UPI001F48BE0E|nr:type II toxin-antitoxin system HigB family toxin [Parabacteroides sp. AF17-28]
MKFIVFLPKRKNEMRIQRRKVIDDFSSKHADASRPLQRWLDIAENNIWSNHAELKQDFPSADYIGEGRYVFNIKGNSYRMVVIALFIDDILTIRFVGTHAEYDKIDCLTI